MLHCTLNSCFYPFCHLCYFLRESPRVVISVSFFFFFLWTEITETTIPNHQNISSEVVPLMCNQNDTTTYSKHLAFFVQLHVSLQLPQGKFVTYLECMDIFSAQIHILYLLIMLETSRTSPTLHTLENCFSDILNMQHSLNLITKFHTAMFLHQHATPCCEHQHNCHVFVKVLKCYLCSQFLGEPLGKGCLVFFTSTHVQQTQGNTFINQKLKDVFFFVKKKERKKKHWSKTPKYIHIRQAQI